ncbi:hypothetical protein CCYA_CCYA17G4272 [Cyanidiococcus yangmingshanensis]|nr:hypothetical protein CCYA_CCYA17G4272 [Cyanidiococcus yangmingshanensis]
MELFKNKNRVPEVMAEIQRAKSQGRFTHQVRPGDRYVNLFMLGLALVGTVALGNGVYSLVTGTGKKEGF